MNVRLNAVGNKDNHVTGEEILSGEAISFTIFVIL